MDLRVAVRETEKGYSVQVLDPPGCWSEGITEAEALENGADAIREYLAVAAQAQLTE